MVESSAYLNGQLIPASRLSIPVDDAGFVLGVTVAEQLRTFRGKLFRLDAHLDRLLASLSIVGVALSESREALAATATEIAAANHALLDVGDDLRLTVLVTPGPMGLLDTGQERPLVAIYTTPVAFGQWASKYDVGESLVTTDVEQVSARCWPPELKCRSRMHYYLADRKAQAIEPGARALILDSMGFVTETTTANILAYRRSVGLLTPPRHKLLPGISLGMISDLATELGVPFLERDMRPDDLTSSDELLMMSTSPCLLPVVRLNGKSIGDGHPGEVFRRLINAWSDRVGLDIISQARKFAVR